MSIDKQIEEMQNNILVKATHCVEEFLVVSLGLSDVFSLWDYFLMNFAYLIVMYFGNIFGMTAYTEGFITSLLFNAKVYLVYIYLQSSKRRYVNPANNENGTP